jgi:hypothetical protein
MSNGFVCWNTTIPTQSIIIAFYYIGGKVFVVWWILVIKVVLYIVASFWWTVLPKSSCLKSYSFGSQILHPAVVCCIFFYILCVFYTSLIFGSFRICLPLFRVVTSWPWIVIINLSFSLNRSARVSKMFDVSVSTSWWLRTCGWWLCSAPRVEFPVV